MDRVFLDANILFSAAYLAESRLNRLWQMKGIELISSDYAATEARRNLPEAGHRARLAELLVPIRLVAELAPMPTAVSLSVEDRPILQAAIQAQATHLLTGDKTHFGAYFGQRVAGVLVLQPADYLAKGARRPKSPSRR